METVAGLLVLVAVFAFLGWLFRGPADGQAHASPRGVPRDDDPPMFPSTADDRGIVSQEAGTTTPLAPAHHAGHAHSHAHDPAPCHPAPESSPSHHSHHSHHSHDSGFSSPDSGCSASFDAGGSHGHH